METARSILAQFVRDARLVAAEEGEVEVHGGHGSGVSQQGEPNLVAGLYLQRLNEVITVDHAVPVGEAD